MENKDEELYLSCIEDLDKSIEEAETKRLGSYKKYTTQIESFKKAKEHILNLIKETLNV